MKTPEFRKITDFPRGTMYDNPEIADKYGLITCITKSYGDDAED